MNCVIDFNKKKSSDKAVLPSEKVQLFIDEVREELEDHLTSINENTNEIQANYEYICQVDAKLSKITERLDQIQLFLVNYGFSIKETPKFECKPLTKREQEVFLLLYTLEEKGAVSYEDLSRRTGMTVDLISSFITTMIEKGVPIAKRYIHDKVYMRLDPLFKKVQAKENILKIQQTIIPNIIQNEQMQNGSEAE